MTRGATHSHGPRNTPRSSLQCAHVFTIYAGAATTVAFRFETDGIIIPMGSGDLHVKVEVTETGPDCVALGTTCPAGQWCPPSSLTGAAQACVRAGTVPVGSACSGPNDCVANASCFDLGAEPACVKLCSVGSTRTACPASYACEPRGDDYGVCTGSSVCGNGVVEAGELCDDGNRVDSDACGNGCTSNEPDADKACRTCRDQFCRSYLGIDLVSACFVTPSADLGADPTDPLYIQQCIDVIDCARANNCAYSESPQPRAATAAATASTPAPRAVPPRTPSAWPSGRPRPAARSTMRCSCASPIRNTAYVLLECDRVNCPACTKPAAAQ